MRPLLLLFVFSVLIFVPGRSQTMQSGIPPINNFSKQDYQAETQNWAVTEDQRGLVYFGNNLGLLEFDGNRWRCFQLPNRSIVHALAVDQAGRIFLDILLAI